MMRKESLCVGKKYQANISSRTEYLEYDVEHSRLEIDGGDVESHRMLSAYPIDLSVWNEMHGIFCVF